MKLFDSKRKFLWVSLSLFSILGMACSGDSPTQSKNEKSVVCMRQGNCSDVNLQDDFALVRASGKSTVIGTNSKSAKANERPEMEVKFTYDYQLGIHEVTCGEFNGLMGSVKIDCDKSTLPAANVTYYDAVLYANAKSKKAKLDTAYIYSSAEFDKNGHCILMEGFKFNPDVNAFRLPTEAEWVFAAGLSFDASNSWNSENSDFKSHEICKKKDKNGFCDLLGNVTEWVNDWLLNFRDTTITNFVGGNDGGSIGERVIKGGNFKNEPSTINLYARGDVYTVTGTSASDYLGFRLAFGKIENPIWLDASGDAVISNVSVVEKTKNVLSILQKNRSKLAFRNDVTGNLAFVDFGPLTPNVVEIKDTLQVYHPDISPQFFCIVLHDVAQ